MKDLLLQQGHRLLSLFLVALVALGTVVGGPLVARVIERMPGLLYIYTGGKPVEESIRREAVEPLPLETAGIDADTLRSLNIPVQNEPQFRELDTSTIFPSGHFITEAGAALIFSAREALWRWDTAEEGLGVSINVVELPTTAWANSLMNIRSSGETPQGQYPEGAVVTREVQDGDEPYEIAGVTFVHDRLYVDMKVGLGPNYLGAAETDSALVFEPVEVARLMSLEIDNNLPALRDLEGWETIPIDDQRPLHAASLGVAAFLTLLIRGFGIRVLDRGSREAISGPIRRRYVAPRARDIDLRKFTRRLRLYSLLRTTGTATFAGAGIIVLYFVSGSLGLIAMFLIVGIGLTAARLIPITVSKLKRESWYLPGRWGWSEPLVAVMSSLIITAGVFCIGTAAIGFATGDHVLLRTVSILALFVGLGVIGFSAFPARFVRRLAMTKIKITLRQDNRPPILFLRSFQDDDIYVHVDSYSRGSQVEKLALLEETTFEDHIAWVASRFGPVTAIGQPGTVLQPLGAARDYFADDEWQTAVLKRINRSSGIMYVVGRSPGAQWELEQIQNRGALGKTVFVFPPLNTNEFIMRCIVLAAGLQTDPAEFFGDLNDGAALVAVRIGESGEVIRYLADGRDHIAYEAALSDALTAATYSTAVVSQAKPELTDVVLAAEADGFVESYNPARRRFRSTDPYRGALFFVRALVWPSNF